MNSTARAPVPREWPAWQSAGSWAGSRSGMRSFACWGRREEDFAQCEISWSLSEIRVYIQGGAGPTRPTSTGPEAKPLPIGQHGGVARSVPAPPPSVAAEQRPRSEQTGTSGGGNLNSTLQQSPDLAPFVRRVETQVRASSCHHAGP